MKRHDYPLVLELPAANPRDRVTLGDGCYWVYGHDRLGQVTSGEHDWKDGTPAAGPPQEFGFDAFGNRTQGGRWTYPWDGENRLRRNRCGCQAEKPDAQVKLRVVFVLERLSLSLPEDTLGVLAEPALPNAGGPFNCP